MAKHNSNYNSNIGGDEDEEIATLERASDVYQFYKVLGRGAFGKVYQTVYKPTGEKIAVKVS